MKRRWFRPVGYVALSIFAAQLLAVATKILVWLKWGSDCAFIAFDVEDGTPCNNWQVFSDLLLAVAVWFGSLLLALVLSILGSVAVWDRLRRIRAA
ncbi:MAG: hypothetical protein HY874_00400 [Chloroflexi bacterium]|nr:hypothetical protein [Chloroflexota bacterium]